MARSRWRRRSRSRTSLRWDRSRSPRLSRSVSRDLLRDEEDRAVVRKIVETQQEVLFKWLEEHKAEVDEKLHARGHRFSNKQIEKQYQVNSTFRELVVKIQAALHVGEVALARDVTETLDCQLGEHEEDLIIVDTSPHGWLAVARLRRGKELPMALRKRLDQVEKELAQTQRKKGNGARPERKVGTLPRKGQEPLVKRPERRLSPEEVLFQAGRQLQPGSCSHCQEDLYYYRECPKFWAKVLESRKAKGDEDNYSQPGQGEGGLGKDGSTPPAGARRAAND